MKDRRKRLGSGKPQGQSSSSGVGNRQSRPGEGRVGAKATGGSGSSGGQGRLPGNVPCVRPLLEVLTECSMRSTAVTRRLRRDGVGRDGRRSLSVRSLDAAHSPPGGGLGSLRVGCLILTLFSTPPVPQRSLPETAITNLIGLPRRLNRIIK